MNKIKIYGDLTKPPFAEIPYNPYDIDSISIAEEEKKIALNEFFSTHTDVKEAYLKTYSSSGEIVATMTLPNRQRPLAHQSQKVTYTFIVERNKPIKNCTYNNLQVARLSLIDYFKKYHNEFEGDEIIEIVNDVVGMGEYQIGKTKYYFKETKE